MNSILFGGSNKLEIIDEKSFSRIYDLFWRSSVDFVLKLVKDIDEAENISQDVFIQIWEKREKLQNIEDIKNFLFVCLRNKAFDHLREIKKSTQETTELWQTLNQENEDAGQADFERHNFEKLEIAIAGLSQHKRKIVSLKFDENKSYEEIGDLLSISTNTVKNHLVQIKKHLRSEVMGSILILFSLLV